MKILGVDPSTAATGWGILEGDARAARALAFGVVRPCDGGGWEERLAEIHGGILAVIDREAPAALVIESTFLHRNVRTALLLGQVRGVILLAAALRSLPVHEYSVSEIKRASVGNGAADKSQVAHMMTRLLGLARKPTPDEADALATAWCHLVRGSIPAALRGAA